MATQNTKRHKDYIASVVDFHLRLPFLWLLVFFVAPLLWLRLRRAVKTRLRKILSSLVPGTPAERCWAAFNQGYRDGLAQKPFDSAYR